MRIGNRPARRVALFLASSLAWAACSSTDPGSEEGSASSDPSPLEQFFETTDGQQAALAAWQLDVQATISECMALEGFDFLPWIADSTTLYQSRSELSEAEWTTEYGYGISTSIESLVRTTAANPNNQHLASLSESDRSEYLTALYGDILGGGTYSNGDPLPPLDEQGCAGEATLQHGGEALGEGYSDFSADWDSGYEDLLALPAVEAATSDWSACMKADGFDFDDPDAARASVSADLETILAPLEGSELLGSPEDLEALFSGTLGEFVEGVPSDFSVDALRALQERERLMAAIDLVCYGTHVAAVLDPQVASLEMNLIERHRSTLESIRDLGS